jgi:hypothetical protein
MFRCDRILWHGDGISQLSYFRGESKFSDHRPVCGSFIVEVEMLDGKSKRRSSNANIRIGAEELLPTSKHNKGMCLLDFILAINQCSLKQGTKHCEVEQQILA